MCNGNSHCMIKVPEPEAVHWGCTSLIIPLGRQRQVDCCEFKTCLVYSVSFRTARLHKEILSYLPFFPPKKRFPGHVGSSWFHFLLHMRSLYVSHGKCAPVHRCLPWQVVCLPPVHVCPHNVTLKTVVWGTNWSLWTDLFGSLRCTPRSGIVCFCGNF